jgi:hypothetical protein
MMAIYEATRLEDIEIDENTLDQLVLWGIQPAKGLVSAVDNVITGDELTHEATVSHAVVLLNELFAKLETIEDVVTKWAREADLVRTEKAPESKSFRKGTSGAKE